MWFLTTTLHQLWKAWRPLIKANQRGEVPPPAAVQQHHSLTCWRPAGDPSPTPGSPEGVWRKHLGKCFNLNCLSSSLFFFWLYHLACGNFFPEQGLNPWPLHWKHRVLTTGPPGKVSTAVLAPCTASEPSVTTGAIQKRFSIESKWCDVDRGPQHSYLWPH